MMYTYILACREGHVGEVHSSLESGFQGDILSGSNDDTPLILACWNGNLSLVYDHIKKKSNINYRNKTGSTPLMEASKLAESSTTCEHTT